MTTPPTHPAHPDPAHHLALEPQEADELDAILADLRTRCEEIPQWEFCDGFLAALACMRRPVPVAEFLPVMLDVDMPLAQAEGVLPLLDVFADAAQQARFLALWARRWNEVLRQLDRPPERLDEDDAYLLHALDLRGAVACLSEAERAELQGQVLPAFAQVWALGFMYAVESWPEEWEPPRDKELAAWLDESMQHIVALTEDDTGVPKVCMYSEEGPPSVSQARLDAMGLAIWAVYDLRQIWKSLGPRQEPVFKQPQPGRNDPCWCGSGKKFKKCHGA